MLSALWNLLFFLVALTVLIAVHEWGHFIAARLCGITVLRFSLGFGPVLWKKTGRNGCEYALSAIPLGGYVKMLGEAGSGGGPAEPDSFRAQSAGRRALVIAAGPLCNILLSVLLYAAVNLSGVTVLLPVVADVRPASAAAAAGFVAEDRVLTVDGREVNSWQDVIIELLPHAGGAEGIVLEVAGERGRGEVRTLVLPAGTLEAGRGGSPLAGLGLRPKNSEVKNVLTRVEPGSPAERAGLLPGDSIVEVDGQSTPNWYRVADAIAGSGGAAIALTVRRDGALYAAEVIPERIYDRKSGSSRAFIGVGVTAEPVPELSHEVRYGPADALVKGAADTARMSRLVVTAVVRLASGALSADSLSGPIAIARGAGESASFGIIFFISFLAAISVNLGILNLLPIPVLDGGQLLFIAYEALLRRAPSARAQSLLTTLGIALLLSLTVFAVFNDLKGL